MLDMIKLSRIAKKYNLKIIEDVPSTWLNIFEKISGFYSDIATFSFYPRHLDHLERWSNNYR